METTIQPGELEAIQKMLNRLSEKQRRSIKKLDSMNGKKAKSKDERKQ